LCLKSAKESGKNDRQSGKRLWKSGEKW
jgi:hypothetical protein